MGYHPGLVPDIPFGPYTLVRRLAVGGMAEVYLARREGSSEPVVVKQILPQLARDPELLQLFLDEAAIADKLAHPSIVRVVDVGQFEGTHFLAMEYVDGVDLSELMRSGKLALGAALRVVIDLARAVHYAHEARDDQGRSLEVIHRDISPQNVLLSRRGEVKLSDFGIARTSLRATRTQTGVLRGKIAYLAPERFAGERADRTVDVYAMGVVLFEIVAGKRPFVGDEARLIKTIMNEPTPELRAFAPDVDPRLAAIVARAMAKTPKERIQTAAALADALEGLGLASSGEELATLVRACADAKSGPHDRPAIPAAPPKLRPATETLNRRSEEPEPGATEAGALLARTATPEPTPSATRPIDETPARTQPMVEAPSVAPAADATRDATERGTSAEPADATRAALEHGTGAARTSAELADATRAALERDGAAMERASLPSSRAQRGVLAPMLAVGALGLLAGWIVTRVFAPAPAPPEPEDAVVAQVPEETRAPAPIEIEPVALPEPTEPPAAVEEEEEPPPRSGVRPKSRAPRTKRVTRGKGVERVERAEAGEGELSIDADPWAYVSIGGRSLGVTPLAHVKLAAGSHRVSLENPESKLSRTVTVVIRADQSTAVRVRLADGKTTTP